MRRLHGAGVASGPDRRDHHCPACAVPPASNTENQRTELLPLTRALRHEHRPAKSSRGVTPARSESTSAGSTTAMPAASHSRFRGLASRRPGFQCRAPPGGAIAESRPPRPPRSRGHSRVTPACVLCPSRSVAICTNRGSPRSCGRYHQYERCWTVTHGSLLLAQALRQIQAWTEMAGGSPPDCTESLPLAQGRGEVLPPPKTSCRTTPARAGTKYSTTW